MVRTVEELVIFIVMTVVIYNMLDWFVNEKK